MKPRQLLVTMVLLSLMLSLSACTKLFGGLRRDMDDQQAQPSYTTGGQWPEHGFLDEDMPEGGEFARYNAVGHSERNPASVTGGQQAPTTWVSQDQATANQRDSMRGVDGENPPSFSNSPNLPPQTRRMYKNGRRATSADFVDDSQNEGSLWASDGQTNYYFTKNRIRGVGDILTIKMEAPFISDIGSEIKRTLTQTEKDNELQAAQDRLNAQAAPAAGAGGSTGPTAPAAPAAAVAPSSPAGGPAPASVSGPTATDKDIDITKAIEAKDGDPIMAEIVERYPNGNYKIRGTKKIIYKNGTPRLLTLMAIARSQDIGEDDVIQSGKLYEYRLEAYR